MSVSSLSLPVIDDGVVAHFARGLTDGLCVETTRMQLRGGDFMNLNIEDTDGVTLASIHFNTGNTPAQPCFFTQADVYFRHAACKGMVTIVLNNLIGWLADKAGYETIEVNAQKTGAYSWAPFFRVDKCRTRMDELIEPMIGDLERIAHQMDSDRFEDLKALIRGVEDNPFALRELIDLGVMVQFDAADERDLTNTKLRRLMDLYPGCTSIPLELYVLCDQLWSGEMDMRAGSSDRARLEERAAQYEETNRMRLAAA